MNSICNAVRFIPPPPLLFSDTYIVFGEAKIEDLSQQAQMAAAEKFKAPERPAGQIAEPTKVMAPVEDESDDEVSLSF